MRRLAPLAVLVSLLALSACSDAPTGSGGPAAASPVAERSDPPASGSREPMPAAPGPALADDRYAVGRMERVFVDDRRPTRSNADFPGAPSRTLRTYVFYPADGAPGDDPLAVPDAPPAAGAGPFPVVVYTHGFTGSALSATNLLTRLASEGYVVLAADEPLTHRDAPGGPLMSDVVEQPGDVSFLLGEAAALGGDGEPLGGLVDAERIGVAGHSLGAITSLMATFHSCCRDERIDAAVSLAGAAVFAPPGGTWFRGVTTPLLMVHGDADPLVLPGLGRQAYAAANSPKAFVSLLGGDHSGALLGADPWFPVVADAVVAFFDAYVAGVDGALTRLRRDADVPGVATVEID